MKVIEGFSKNMNTIEELCDKLTTIESLLENIEGDWMIYKENRT